MSTDVAAVPPVPAPMTPLAYRVARRLDETADVVTLDLEPVGAGIDEPTPGQFTMLYGFGAGEVPISVSGCPGDDGLLRHTIRSVGPVTRALCRLAPGDPVGVRGPFGVGWPLDAAVGRDLVVVGGGIGLAPLRPVLRRVLPVRDHFGRIALLVGARTPDSLVFAAELREWRGRFDLEVEVTVDVARSGWRGDVGVVTKLLPRLRLNPARTVAFVCGPEVMMRVVAHQLLAGGIDPGHVHVSLERNMRCGIAQCGHCQIGPMFVCTDGPVVPWSTAAPLLEVRAW